MADEPPPLDVEEEKKQTDEPEEDSQKEVEDKKESDAVEQDTKEVEEEPAQEKPSIKLEDSDDLFGEDPPDPVEPVVTSERPHTDSEPPTLEPSEPEPKPKQTSEAPPPPAEPSSSGDLFGEDEEEPEPKSKPLEKKAEEQEEEEEEEEEEDIDQYDFTITISEPEKVGDGMGAYMTYLVTTKTSLPTFKSPEFFVRRRFSDFLGLYYRLSEKYTHLGRIVPPAPEKSVSGMTRVKFSKSEEGGAAFIERRRASLERFLRRLSRHPVIRKDDDLRNFLESAGELPKAKDTAAMSGAGLMRLVKNVGESISKVAGKKGDSDTWFEDRQQEYEVLEHHLKKLHSAVETMISGRKELCSSTSAFVKSISTLANVEENNSVSRALTRLSEVEERVEGLHQEQSNKDLYVFGETIKDYIMLINSIKETFTQRVKVFTSWVSAQKTLQNKREQEAKLTASGKVDKLPLVQDEIHDWEKREKDGQKAFEKCSKVLKREIERFETERTAEFKAKFVEHLESLMNMQEELIRLWEEYLPDAQGIEVEV